MLEDILVGFAALALGYLAGSIAFSRVVTRLVSPATELAATVVPVAGTEARIPMSRVSATSVRFQLGSRYGCLASLLDMAKVALPVAAFKFLFPDMPAPFLAALGGLLGHNWPVYYRFAGGYGHSAIYGALLVLEWTAVPVSFVGTALVYLVVRQVQLAALGGVLALIPWFWYLGYGGYGLLYAGVCGVAYASRILPDYRAAQAAERA